MLFGHVTIASADIIDQEGVNIGCSENCSVIANYNDVVRTKDTFKDVVENNPNVFGCIVVAVALVGTIIILMMNRNKKKALYKIINIDELTDVLTIRNFKEKAKKILQTANENEYVLISLDVDNFQYINEIYGYEKGSNILVDMATKISAQYGRNALIVREKK